MPPGEILLEVRSEEIPARMLATGCRELATRLFEELVARRLVPSEVATGFTPRRIAVSMQGLPEREPDREELQVGPPAEVAWDDEGKPTKALEGFARRCEVDPEEVERVDTERGLYAGVKLVHQGRSAEAVLRELIPQLVAKLRWPQSMRWNERLGPWVRPVHGLVAILGGEVVPCELFGVSAGDATVGHPIVSPESFTVRSWETYLQELAGRQIEVRFEPRRQRLADDLEAAARDVGGRLIPDAELLDRLTCLCEIPRVLTGEFEEHFLKLPREALQATLRGHQSAFTVESDGNLMPIFLTVMDRPDDPEGLIRKGNEWVVAARLNDSDFFIREDLRHRLGELATTLERLSFHELLGSYADKHERLVKLSEQLCSELDLPHELESAQQAAALLKADLMTELVREFTELQGVVGGIYARREGYSEEIWQAIYDQYLPAASSDEIPRGRVGQIVGLADRIDTLVGLFGVGEIPSGSRDPYGLRRAAQGIVRILFEGNLVLDLDLVVAKAARLYGERLDLEVEEILAEIRPYLMDRIRYLLSREGFAADEIDAALAAGRTDLPDLRARVAALHTMRQRPEFSDVVQAARRIVNILREQPDHELDEELLQEEAELTLYEAGRELEAEVAAAAAREEYQQGFEAVAEFADALDRFFEEVLVMDENAALRANRLALLQSTNRTLSRLAELHQLATEPPPRALEEEEATP